MNQLLHLKTLWTVSFLLISSYIFSLSESHSANNFSENGLAKIVLDTLPGKDVLTFKGEKMEENIFAKYATPINELKIKKSSASGYSVQFGGYDNLKFANQKMDRVRMKLKEPVFLVFEKKDGKPIYKVYVGQFPTAADAQKLIDNLKKIGVNGVLVDF